MINRRMSSGLIGAMALTLSGCSGGRPPLAPGVAESQLAPCPASPNCVSSRADAAEQRVEPLSYTGEAAPARTRLLNILRRMERVRIVQSRDDYLHAEFRSAVFGFVDDGEFYFHPSGTIQVRSASRSGYYDFGVNRERVEGVRAQFDAALAKITSTTAK